MKRLLALLFATLLLAAAWRASREVDERRARAVRGESARAAQATGMRAAEALAAQVHALEPEAEKAAHNPRLVAALRANSDAATLQDLFRTEDWWEPYRNAFRVYAVAFEGDKLDVIEGMRTADLASDLLVREARERKAPVAEVVTGRGWPYMAAATTVDVPARAKLPVLVLARPVDEETLGKLADKAGGALLLSDGAHPVIEAGSATEREVLKAAVGTEAKAPVFEAGDGTEESWAAAASPVVPGLWLWAYGRNAALAHDRESGAMRTKSIIWVLAGVLALATLVFGSQRPSGAPLVVPVTEAAAVPAVVPAVVPAPGGRSGVDGDGAGSRTRAGLGPSTGSGARSDAGRSHPRVGGESIGENASEPRLRVQEGVPTSSFGRYRLLDLLGEGGMAQVFTAVTFGAEGFRRAFVVKRLRAELSRDPAVVAQFIDEANLGSTLVHSNIIPVFDFGKVSEEYFLAQEYILGRDLGRLTTRALERHKRALQPALVLYVASETLQALEYAHGKLGEGGRPVGLVHRDVSPSNILVSARGEVKLFDFGIVKAEGRVTKTQHGVVKGNVSFMSPEQARGLAVDGRADLFSLGLVIFYCLTGEILYRGETTYELLVKAATGPGPEELARIAALPAPCGAIVGKALEIDPARRYQNAVEFAAALAPHLMAGAADAGALMSTLFGEDFRAEEARFATALPNSERALPAGDPARGQT